MKKHLIIVFLIVVAFIFYISNTNAADAIVTSSVYMRSGPSTNYETYETLPIGTVISILDTVSSSDSQCSSRSWYKYIYNGKTGYSCSSKFDTINKYNRPWDTPGKSIYNGAKWIASGYIAKGQDTSYLTRFNVTPNSSYGLYSHQYMTNVRGACSEATRTYKAYSDNKLLSQPLVFTIPIFKNMPNETKLIGGSSTPPGTSIITDLVFEAALDAQEFNETYKSRLRELHNKYPNWSFVSLKTNVEWNDAVSAEQATSLVDSGDEKYCENCSVIEELSNWRRANVATTAFYLDPRNFLDEDDIFMFLKMSYSPVETEEVISSMIKNTFMSGTSTLDNKTYAKIFIEAGTENNISPIFLVSKVIQEVGVNGGSATSGAKFTYDGKAYSGIYNFYNIGANSGVYDGLFWASNGLSGTQITPNENSYLNNYGLTGKASFATGINIGTTVAQIINKNSTLIAKITDASGVELGSDLLIGTGATITISDGTAAYNYQAVIYGDISGDGSIDALDLLYLRQQLLGTKNLSGANLEAAKIAKADTLNALDLLYLRRYLLDSATYNIAQ